MATLCSPLHNVHGGPPLQSLQKGISCCGTLHARPVIYKASTRSSTSVDNVRSIYSSATLAPRANNQSPKGTLLSSRSSWQKGYHTEESGQSAAWPVDQASTLEDSTRNEGQGLGTLVPRQHHFSSWAVQQAATGDYRRWAEAEYMLPADRVDRDQVCGRRASVLVTTFAVTLLALLSPVGQLEAGVLGFGLTGGIAIAGPIDKLHTTEEAFKSVLNFKVGKFVEKITSSLSISRTITPDTVQKNFKALTEENPYQQVPEDLGLLEKAWVTLQYKFWAVIDFFIIGVQSNWESLLDLVTNANPVAEGESLWASFSAWSGGALEGIAAFELSTLVETVERWIFFSGIVALPMWLSMRAVNAPASLSPVTSAGAGSERNGAKKKVDAAEAQAQEAALRGIRVMRELERLEIKATLASALQSMGEAAVTTSRSAAMAARGKEVDDLLLRLQLLSPQDDPLTAELYRDDAAASGSGRAGRHGPDLDGTWRLIYIATDRSAQGAGPSQQQEARPGEAQGRGGGLGRRARAQPPGRRQQLLPLGGLEVKDVRQAVRHATVGSSAAALTAGSLATAQELIAHSSAEVRLGPLGVVHIEAEGKWLEEGPGHIVLSFDGLTARLRSFLGSQLSDDLPLLSLPLPRALQDSIELESLYLDNQLRINKAPDGTKYVFERIA